MPLCNICRSIPFENLPAFPEEDYGVNLTGLRYYHNLSPSRNLTEAQSLARIKYHGSMLDLRLAAADSCELCQLVKDQIDVLLAELDGLDHHQRMLERPPPTFEMWLTKRPKGGDGFWVLSECRGTSRPGTTATLPLAAISFGASDNDALAAKFRGRPIRTVPGTEAFAQIKRWIADCDANHQCCSPTVPLPKTLLDVGLSDSESSIKVVHFSDGIVGRYTALSYLHERGIKSDEASPAIFQHESSTVDVTMLPRLFQDAIWLTRELGIKYIWIDAICMAHNRGTNLKRDSAAFASIYINATLTLAATGSRYGSEGLFPYRPTRPSIHVPHRASDGTSGNLWMQVLPLDKEVLLRKPYIEMTSEPLYKGVWAFQERVLSPRILHFASDQIYFECMVYFVSEDGLLLDDRYHTIHNIDPDTGLLRWFMLLRTYGQLNLVEATDKLPALANIARSYQAILNDEYVAGCWKKQLVESLCWQSLHCKPAGLHRAPSWSWASVDGIPGMQFHGRTWESLVTIHNTHVELEGLDPFGKVKEAWINLEAPLMPLTLAKSQDVTEHIFLRTKEGSEDGFHAGLDTIPRAYSASAETVRSLRLFALVLVEIRTLDSTTAKSGYGVSYRGIIVVPVDGSAEQLKRVGFFIASGEVLAPGNVSSHKKVITLV